MAATLMDGKALAARIRAEVEGEVAAFPRPIGLATVLVGDDPASEVYIRLKHKATLEVGMEARDLRLPATTSGPTTETGITVAPVCASCARDHASSSCESASSPTTPRIASRRALIYSASFFRGQAIGRAYSRVRDCDDDGRESAGGEDPRGGCA